MANLSELFGGGESEGALEESLPTFFVHSAYNAGTYSGGTYDSFAYPITSGYPDTGSEAWGQYNNALRTYDSGSGTGTVSSRSGDDLCTFQGVNYCQAEGHWRLWYPSNGISYAPVIKQYQNFINSNWAYYGTIIGTVGKRQRVSIYAQNDTLEVHRRGSYRIDSLGIGSTTYLETSGRPANTSYGTISYNERTGKLAYLQGNSSNSYRLHVWTNPNINLNNEDYLVGDLHLFLSQAKAGTNGASYFYNDFSWTSSGSTSYSESQYHNRLIMGDNGRIGIVRMTPSNETRHVWIQPNPAGTSLTTSPQNVSNLSLTTSYGIEQGSQYGMRTNITWDNKFIAAYSVYYYYGAGINCHFVSTEDPSVGYTYQQGDSSWGWPIFPIGKSDFAMHYVGTNANSGSGGVQFYTFSPVSAYRTGLNNNGTSTISSGQTLNPRTNRLAIDTGYTSTNYVHVGPMNNWKKVG